jgi:hypothetical protein
MLLRVGVLGDAASVVYGLGEVDDDKQHDAGNLMVTAMCPGPSSNFEWRRPEVTRGSARFAHRQVRRLAVLNRIKRSGRWVRTSVDEWNQKDAAGLTVFVGIDECPRRPR